MIGKTYSIVLKSSSRGYFYFLLLNIEVNLSPHGRKTFVAFVLWLIFRYCSSSLRYSIRSPSPTSIEELWILPLRKEYQSADTLPPSEFVKVPMKWNFCLLFYSRKLKSMLHWFIIFEFKLCSGARNNFLSLQSWQKMQFSFSEAWN